MAHLKACGEWRLSELDQSHPVIASATLAEITAAIQEASRALRCHLENRVERWMTGGTEFQTGIGACWKPLREALYENLEITPCRTGFSMFVFNPIEVFQVCHRRYGIANKWLLHVQPLSSPEAAGYYKLTRSLSAMRSQRMEQPMHTDFTPTRSPFGSMSSSMAQAMMDHTAFSDLPEWEIPLFSHIASAL